MASRIRSFLSTSRRRRSQAGFSIIEGAVIFLPIFIMTLLVLEVTNILRVYETLSWTAEYAVRQASEGMREKGDRYSSQEVKAIIEDKLEFSLPIGEMHINPRDVFCVIYFKFENVEDLDDSEFSCSSNFDDEASFQPGDLVRARVRLHYEPIFSNIFKLLFSEEILTMSSTFDRVISAESAAPPPSRGTPRSRP